MPPHYTDLTTNNSLLSSETIEVVAESGKKRFFVHSGILTTQPEAAGKAIDLLDWDGDTVGRLLQFLYIGDYQFPEAAVKQENTEEAGECKKEEGEKGEEGEGEKEGEGKVDDEDKEEVEEEKGDGMHTPNTAQSTAAREGWKFEDMDANVLLVHAKTYALAQYRGVEALQTMALERLRMALGGIDNHVLTESADIIELLEYVYSHTHTRASLGEPIRNLVSNFAAENIDKLEGRKEMETLLRERNGFAVDLVREMLKRVCVTENKICDVEKDAQDWKSRATVLQEKVRELEATNNDQVLQLEVMGNTMHESEASGAEKVKKLMEEVERLKAEDEEKTHELEVMKKEAQEYEEEWREEMALNSKRVRELDAANAKIRRLKTVNAEKTRDLESANEHIKECEEEVDQLKSDNVKKFRRLKAAYEEKVQELDAANEEIKEWEEGWDEQVEKLEDANAEEVEELENENKEKVRELKAAKKKIRQLEELVEEIEAANAKKVRRLKEKMRELQ